MLATTHKKVHSTPTSQSGGSKRSNILPTRQSERMRNRNMCHAGGIRDKEPCTPDVAFRNKKMHSIPKPERLGSKCSYTLPARRSWRIGTRKTGLTGRKRDEECCQPNEAFRNKEMHSTLIPQRVGPECSVILPTRRSERIRKGKMSHCDICTEIEKEGRRTARRGGSGIKKQKVNSAPQGDESEERLPIELRTEVLRFLSVKCLSKFKCVSKSWHAAIEEHYFIMKHCRQAKCVHIYDKQDGNVRRGEETFVALYSVDGLVLERTKSFHKYRIRNPAAKQILDLPDPQDMYLHMILMYLPNSEKYKLAYFYRKSGTEFGGCKILTMERVLQWRTLDIPCLKNLGSEKLVRIYAVGIGGLLFSLSHANSEIVCIDMESESFSSVKIPRLLDFFSGSENVRL